MTTHGAYSLGLYQRVHGETEGRNGLSDEHILEGQRVLTARGAWWFDSFGTAGDWGVSAPTWGHAHHLPEWILEVTAGRRTVSFYRQAALLGKSGRVRARAAIAHAHRMRHRPEPARRCGKRARR